jgi:hypothetical protein
MAVQWNLSPVFCEGAMGGKKTVNASIELWEKHYIWQKTQEKNNKGENFTFPT